jgi:NAD(P)H dehydrogenase (quinone)
MSKSRSGSGIRRVLVVFAHPDGTSLCGALAQAVRRGLETGGKQVDFVDLYADEFRAAMTSGERIAYETQDPIQHADVARYAEMVKACDALVVVYPTWNMGYPAILKGFFERVMVPGVAFEFNEKTGVVRGSLGHIRRFVGVTTYGSPRWVVRLTSDMGRRMLTRGLRAMAPTIRSRCAWHGLYGLNRPDPARITAFIGQVEQAMVRL